ncbi:O-antigen polymerase [Chitinophaga sp. Cy-1792]|uniref:O-antigen polymerase n=1 Tax=Chitinophaga sp. Cy-1792 TaxID=2608339 RepID=UPI0014228E6B|nr:O-antigen polymerase [Chitinophaga sp. Cy-1792]
MSFIYWQDLTFFSYLGTIIILIARDTEFNDLISTLVGGDETKIKVWLVVSYVMLSFPVGMYFAKLCWKYKVKEFELYRERKIIPMFSPQDSYMRYPLYALSALCLLAVVYTYLTIGFIPILRSFSVSSEIEVMQMRTALDRGFTGNVYFKNIFGLLLTPIVTLIAFCYYRMTFSRKDLIWFLVMMFATFLILTYDMSKSPFVRFLLAFFFMEILIRKINFKVLLKYAGLILAGLVAFFIMIGKKGEGGLGGIFGSITARIAISQISSLYKHMEIFPAEHAFIGFNSISQVLPFMTSSERSARIVMEIASPSWIEMDMGGVYNTLFIGEAYANFGWIGVILCPIWIGFLIQTLFIVFIRLKKTPIFLGLFVFYSFNSNITGGVNEYFYNIQTTILSLTILTVLIIAYSLYYSKNRENLSSVAIS